MRGLLVAPIAADLPNVGSEIFAVLRSGLDVVQFPPDGSEQALIRRLQAETFAFVFFAMHGGPDGILLADGWASATAITQHIRSAGIQAVYLNTCESADIARQVHNETSAHVIATIAQISDRDAARSMAYFAPKLAETGDFRIAFDAVHVDGDRLIYIPAYAARKPLGMAAVTPGASSPNVDGLRAKIDRLSKLLDGDPDINFRGLRSQIADQETKLDDMATKIQRLSIDVSELSKSVKAQTRLTWTIAGVAFLLILVLLGYAVTL